MANMRFRIGGAILRNLRGSKINNVCHTIHRRNHVLSGSLTLLMNRTSPSLTSIRNANPFKGTYRLEHTKIIPAAGVTSEKIIAPSSAGSIPEVPKSNAVEGVSQVKKVDTGSADAAIANSKVDESVFPPIPEPPSAMENLPEPALESIGLGGWTPPGIVHQILEYFHLTFDMPWWACIVSFTVLMKLLLFPLTVKSRKLNINFQNNMPRLKELQNEMTLARKSGNYYEAARAAQELQMFMQKSSLSPLATFGSALVQVPVFLSVYFALRRMGDSPNFTSYQTGGALWFPDLAIPDQYYLLPLFTSLTLWAMLKKSSGAFRMPAHLPQIQQTVLNQVVQLGVPAIVFLFTMKFPAGLLCYWGASNLFAFCQLVFMELKPVQKYFNIPKLISHPPPKMEGNKNLGVIGSFKESLENMRITQELEQREYANSRKFQDLGNEPARRTFKFDPKLVEAVKTKRN